MLGFDNVELMLSPVQRDAIGNDRPGILGQNTLTRAVMLEDRAGLYWMVTASGRWVRWDPTTYALDFSRN